MPTPYVVPLVVLQFTFSVPKSLVEYAYSMRSTTRCSPIYLFRRFRVPSYWSCRVRDSRPCIGSQVTRCKPPALGKDSHSQARRRSILSFRPVGIGVLLPELR